MDSFRSTEFRLNGDQILRIHHWPYDDGESEEIKEVSFERPEYNPNSVTIEADRFWEENARFMIVACNSYFQLLDSCKAACNELERITGDIGFEPERFRERLQLLGSLASAIKHATPEDIDN